MRFYFDVNVSPKLARALAALEDGVADVTIVHGSEKFAPNTPDTEWIRQLGAEGDWIIVTADRRIARTPDERAAWRESGLTTYFFSETFAEAAHWAQAVEVVKQWPDLRSHARRAPAGSAWMVPWRQKLRSYDA